MKLGEYYVPVIRVMLCERQCGAWWNAVAIWYAVVL